MSALILDPAADFRQRVEIELAPFSPTLDEIDAMVAAQGNVCASALVFHAMLDRLQAEFDQQGGVFQ